MFVIMAPYQRAINEGGRRRRNERFWRGGLNTDWRRRSNRKRRVRFWRRGRGASERKRGSDKSGGDDVRNGSKVGRGGGGNIGLDNQSR
jgi:hypothetical protein